MADRHCFVQFPHPGDEHEPDGKGKTIGWNKTHRNRKPNKHERKFMQLRGKWIERDGTKGCGDLWAWGEWEPESTLITEFNPPRGDRQHPHYLWEPYYVPKRSYCGLHNTDPFIFGDCFLYSNCRQTSGRSLKRLARGSVIAFGSSKRILGEWKWLLDTVLVVRDSIPYDPLHPREALKGMVPDAFLSVTGGPLTADPKLANRPEMGGLRLYQGATPNDPVHGMFSFFPAITAGGDSGFPRPLIEDLPDKYINPKSFRAPSGLTTQRSCAELSDLWNRLVEQVRSAGLVLGTHAALPPERREG